MIFSVFYSQIYIIYQCFHGCFPDVNVHPFFPLSYKVPRKNELQKHCSHLFKSPLQLKIIFKLPSNLLPMLLFP